MGQMVKKIYEGVFIDLSDSEDFQDVQAEDDFYNDFYDKGDFISAYQGLETINVLIPTSNAHGRQIEEETVITDIGRYATFIEEFKKKYQKHISLLNEYKLPFKVTFGVVTYWDEEA